MRQFVTITGTDEHTAINCLSLNDWRIDAATDNFFTDPVRYFVEPPKAAVDKKKLDQLFNKYRSESFTCLPMPVRDVDSLIVISTSSYQDEPYM